MASQLLLSLLFCFVLCSGALSFHAELEAGRWRANGVAKSSAKSIVLSLEQRNLEDLDQFFWDVSNPKSPIYGQYKTAEEMGAMIGRSDSELTYLVDSLLDSGFEKCDIYRTKDSIRCTGSTDVIAKVFSLEHFEQFRCVFTGRTMLRSRKEYKIPSHLSYLVQMVHGISDFPPLSLTHKFGSTADNFLHELDDTLSSDVSKPIYISVRSRTLNEVLVEVIPPCSGGSFELGSVCASNPVVSASGVLYPAIDTMEVSNQSFSGIEVDCTGATNYGDFPFCSFTITHVPAYVPWIIEYQLTYQDQTVSPTFTYQHFTVSTPQLVVQSVLDMYSVPKGLRVTNPNATQCVAEFEQQYYSPSDLSLFFELNGLDDYSDIVTLIGPNEQGTQPGTEGNLDIQWMMGIAPGSPTIYWSNYANSTKEIDHILTWQYEIGNMTDPPLVSSLSYAMTESTANNFLGDGYIQRSNTQFQVLASMGLTMIFSAGDAGSNSLSAPPMGQLHCFPSHAMWPAESPYVTALSATYFTPLTDPICYLQASEGGINCLGNPLGEAAVGIDYGMFWTTGGGFSNVSSSPSYQTQQVQHYLATANLPPSDYFNSNGRAYPDVATVGHNLEIVLNGESRVLDGTSASAPIFGGLITLLNDLRLNSGSPPLGFLNPLLYGLSQTNSGSFRDVTVGHNACGGFGPPYCCADGFYASPGWDAVSGLGSPNFLVLYNAIKEMQ